MKLNFFIVFLIIPDASIAESYMRGFQVPESKQGQRGLGRGTERGTETPILG